MATIPTLSFKNDLSYSVVVYDSFDTEDSDDDAQGNFFGTLTSLGTVSPGVAVDIQPIHASSSFIVENATNKKPVKRCTKLQSNKTITSFEITQADEDAMTATFAFIDFYLKNPNDPMSQAFTAILNSDPAFTGIGDFFPKYPAYASCTYQTYMMAATYNAITPATLPKPPAETTYSLSQLASMLGAKWPAGLPDIEISNPKISDKNDVLNITGDIDISTLSFETPQITQNVSTILGSKKVFTFNIIFNHAVSLGIFGTRLSLLFDTIDISAGNSTVTITKPTITVDINPLFKFVVFTLSGTMPFNVFGKAFDANLSLTVDNVEAAVGVTITGDNTSLPSPPGLKGVHFDEFGVGMGIIFEPPAFALGVEGKLHIGSDDGKTVVDIADDTFAVICAMESEIPTPVYASFYVPKMDINEALAIFTNKTANLDVPVNFTDLSFKWAANPMEPYVLPDGTLTQMAYGFSGAASILSFSFFGDVEIDANNGLTANIQMSPMSLGNVFKLSGDGPGVTLNVDASGNPIKNNQIRDSQVLQQALASSVKKQMVPAGGPVLAINTLTMPILHLNAKASLFEVVGFEIEADIDKTGITFLLDYGAVLKEKMSVTLSDFHNLAASYEYYIDTTITVPVVAGVKLGSFHLTADVEGHLSVSTSTAEIVMKAGGSFSFESLSRSFGDFTADINISKLSDLIAAAISNIESEAKTIFSDFLNDAQQWTNKVKAGFITGADAVGTVLRYAFNADSIAVARIMKAAGYTIDEISTNIKNAWNCAVGDVTYALKAVGYLASDVATSVKNVFGAGAQDVSQALKAMGYAADDIAAVIRNVFGGDSIAVAQIMKAIGFGIDQISQGIKDAWNCGVNDVTYALKAAGYAAVDVANSVKNIFNAGVNDVTGALKAMGYAADDVANGIKNAFNLGENDVAAAMKQAGYTATEAANAIKDTFNAGVNDVTGALKYAGYAATDVASTIKNVFNISVNAVSDAMKSVGYAGDDIKNAFESLGGDFEDFVNNVIDKLNPANW